MSKVTLKKRKNNKEWMYQHQRDLARVERDYSISEMGITMAHELNQPLAAITTYLQGSIRHLENNDYKKKDLLNVMRHAVTQTKRAGKIIHHMKESVPKNILSKKKTDINEMVRQTLRLIQQEIKQFNVKVKIKLNKSLPDLYVDAMLIKQAFISIIHVVFQMMKNESIFSPCLTIKSMMNKKSQFEVHLIHKGAWIDAQNSPALFESYFMTTHKDLTLRLSIARAILHAHDGALHVYSYNGEETCFKCILPIKKE